MKPHRIVSLDLIRTVAILLVIMQHSWSGLHLDDPSLGIGCHSYQALVVLGVPLFFMLSGALLLGAGQQSIETFLGKRMRRLLIPYLLWGTFVYLLSVAMHKYPDVDTPADALQRYIPYLLSGKINISYWYIFALIGLYLLTPFLQRALCLPQAKQLLRYGLFLWVGWLLLSAYYPQFGSLTYYNSLGFRYLGFFLAGYYAVHFLTDRHTNRLFGLIGFPMLYALNVIGLTTGINTSPIHAMAAVCLFLLLLSFKIPTRSKRFVTSTGRYAYVIYFVHVMIVSMLCILDIWTWCPLWIRPLVVTSLSFLLSYLIAHLLDRFRLVPNAWVGI